MSEELLKTNQFAFAGTEERPRPQDFPEKGSEIPLKVREPYVAPIVRYAFYGYVATIPFETIDLGIPLEITAISLGLLLAALVFQIPLCVRKPPAAYWCFFFYGFVFALPVLTGWTPFRQEAMWQLMVLMQLLIMSWVAFNLMKSDRVARDAMLVFGIACGLLAVMQIAGVSGRTTNFEESIQRTTALGFHPNNIARIFALALLTLFGLTYGAKKKFFKPQYLVWILFVVIGVAIIQTGSRGALLALGGGLLVFVLRTGSFGVKVRNAVLTLVGIGFFAVLAYQSDVTRERFEKALDEGDLARRELIFPTAWEMFTEKPIFGWGAKTSEFELGTRLGHIEESSKNPHNLILFTLVTTGLVGTIPMLIGIGLAFAAAWKARHGPRGVLPLSLLVTVMIANMSGLWLHNKMHWLVIAYALSSVSVYAVRVVRRSPSPAEFAAAGRPAYR